MHVLPVLYSFRRCPYAMRARLALYVSQIDVEIREVHLANKPAEMLVVSPKATVPVLLTSEHEVLDESLDIMQWALAINDPRGWLSCSADDVLLMKALIMENDTVFKQHLDHYKYAERFPESPAEYHRQQGEVFLTTLEQRLTKSNYLFAEQPAFGDLAIFPFIRQFAAVDDDWFKQSPYLKLQRWLERLTHSAEFIQSMKKLPIWKPGDKPVVFSANP